MNFTICIYSRLCELPNEDKLMIADALPVPKELRNEINFTKDNSLSIYIESSKDITLAVFNTVSGHKTFYCKCIGLKDVAKIIRDLSNTLHWVTITLAEERIGDFTLQYYCDTKRLTEGVFTTFKDETKKKFIDGFIKVVKSTFKNN